MCPFIALCPSVCFCLLTILSVGTLPGPQRGHGARSSRKAVCFHQTSCGGTPLPLSTDAPDRVQNCVRRFVNPMLCRPSARRSCGRRLRRRPSGRLLRSSSFHAGINCLVLIRPRLGVLRCTLRCLPACRLL